MPRTNNYSIGCHNRFQILVGRHHPSFYCFLTELQKEQAYIEYTLREISLGKNFKNLPQSSFQKKEESIFSIVSRYHEYADENDELTYLKLLGYYINL